MNLCCKNNIFILGLLFFSFSNIYSQKRLVKGIISDKANNPIPFATVAFENGHGGTICDENGKFGLHVFGQDYSKLVVSSVGYESKHITVNFGDDYSKFIRVHLSEKTNDLNEVVVNGQSIVQQINNSAYNAIAIDAAKLHNTTDNLANALAAVPGIRLRESGGVGSDMRLTLDGFTGQQVKIFIDGVPQDGVGRSFGLNNIPVNFAERIEVYRGVVPVGFGADALGGVINIVTNKKRKTYLDASYSYGSFNTHQSNVNFGKTTDSGLFFELTAFQNYSDNSYYVDTPVKDFETGVWDASKIERVKRFHDTYHNEAVGGKVGLTDKKMADRLVLGLTYSQSDKEIQNGVVQTIVYGAKRRKDQSLMSSLEYCKKDLFTKGLSVTLTANYNVNNFHNIDTTAYEYNWRGESRYTGSLGEQSYQDTEYQDQNVNSTFTATYSLAEAHSFVFNHVLTGFKRETVAFADPDLANNVEASLIDKVSLKNISGLSYRFRYNHAWNISVFGKYYNQYGSGPVSETIDGSTAYVRGSQSVDIFGYGTATSYSFNNDIQLKFSAERAVRLPTADQLFGDEDLELGVSSLEPEKSINLNTSLSYKYEFGKNSLFAEGGLIYRDTRDYIRRTVEKLSGGVQAGSHQNHGRVITKGVNAEMRYSRSKFFSLGGNLTYLNIRDNERYVESGSLQESTTYRARMPNKPYFFTNMDASVYLHDFIKDNNTLTIIYDNAFVHEFPLYWEVHGSSNKKRVPSQFSHNLSLMYSMKQGRYNVSFECKNFTDEKMYDNFSLQKPGRAFYGKLRYYFNK